MAAVLDRVEPGSAPAGKRRVLIIVLAGVALLAAVLLVTKLVMPRTAPSNPIAAVTSAPGKARAVAAASSAASAKLNEVTGSTAAPTTTPIASPTGGHATTALASPLTGPKPDTSRNPFLP